MATAFGCGTVTRKGIPHQPQLGGRTLGYRAVQVLAFVTSHIETHGIAPTYEMICDATGISTRAKVSDVVSRLERRGLLRRAGDFRVRSRGLSHGRRLEL